MGIKIDKIVVCLLVFTMVNSFLIAHPGRLDRNGGHNGPNGYHYHRGSGSGGYGPNRDEVIESDVEKMNEILQILRSSNPVNEVSEMDADYIGDLSKYAALGPTSLEYNDRTVFTDLVNTEFDRRDENRDKYSPFISRLQRSEAYLKSDIAQGKEVEANRRKLQIVQLFILGEQ
jgi:hypothetical protein